MSEIQENQTEFNIELVKSGAGENPTEQPVEQPVEQPDPIANVPKIFCADKEIAKGLLIDLFAMIGTLKAIEQNDVNPETLPIVLVNAQKILTNLSDILIRDCAVTDAELDEVMNVFKEVGKEAEEQLKKV